MFADNFAKAYCWKRKSSVNALKPYVPSTYGALYYTISAAKCNLFSLFHNFKY